MNSRVKFFIEEEKIRGLARARMLRNLLNAQTCQLLEEQGWGIALAMVDFSADTGHVISEINKKFPGLPITAWVVLPDEDGYYTTKFNVAETRAKVREIIGWADRFNVRFDSFGFDIEPPLATVRALSSFRVKDLIRQMKWARRLGQEQKKRGYCPETDMNDLLVSLRQLGISTESYEMPGILDSSLLGVLRAEKIAFTFRSTMAYSSLAPKFFQGCASSVLLKKGTYPALGVFSSTGKNPGRDSENDKRFFGRKELQRDICQLARKGKKEGINIFEHLWVFALTDIRVVQWTKDVIGALEI